MLIFANTKITIGNAERIEFLWIEDESELQPATEQQVTPLTADPPDGLNVYAVHVDAQAPVITVPLVYEYVFF